MRRGVVFPDSIERYVARYVVGCRCDNFAVFACRPALELLARRSGEAVCGKCVFACRNACDGCHCARAAVCVKGDCIDIFPDSIERYVARYVICCRCDNLSGCARCPALELLARGSGEAVCGKCVCACGNACDVCHCARTAVCIEADGVGRDGNVFPDSIERYVTCYVIGCRCDDAACRACCPALELLARGSGEAVCGKCVCACRNACDGCHCSRAAVCIEADGVGCSRGFRYRIFGRLYPYERVVVLHVERACRPCHAVYRNGDACAVKHVRQACRIVDANLTIEYVCTFCKGSSGIFSPNACAVFLQPVTVAAVYIEERGSTCCHVNGGLFIRAAVYKYG